MFKHVRCDKPVLTTPPSCDIREPMVPLRPLLRVIILCDNMA